MVTVKNMVDFVILNGSLLVFRRQYFLQLSSERVSETSRAHLHVAYL
jgi:hypothetical protein